MVEKHPEKLDVRRFFGDIPMAKVRPEDRMLACWSHLVMRVQNAKETMKWILRKHRKDSLVLEKMWSLQAIIITLKLGHFQLLSGEQETREVNK